MLTNLEHHSDKIFAKVILDPDHAIFKGHYSGKPVLPGACMLQIVRDTLEAALNRQVVLKQAPQMKFLLMVDPRQNSELAINLNIKDVEGLLKVWGSLMATEKPCFKFSGTFARVD